MWEIGGVEVNDIHMIRKATIEDASRIAEILVFVKRMKFRPIFQDDAYSFVELQVLPVAKKYIEAGIIDNMFVYDDGIVKGLIHIEGNEIASYMSITFSRTRALDLH